MAEALFDGTANPRELEKLEQTLTADPALREIWDDLVAARGALADAGLEEAPHGLRPAILRAVAVERRERGKRDHWFGALLATFRARPALAMGSALATGIVIGAVGIAAITGGFEAGNRIAPSTVATMPAAPEAAAPVLLDLGGAHVEARTGRDQEVTVHLDVRPNGNQTTTVTVTPDAASGKVRVELRTDAGLREGTLSRP
jgi:hypothetical protein